MGVAPRACIRGVFNAVIWSVATVVVLPIGMVCGAWASCCGAGEELCGCGCVTRAYCAEHTHTWRTDETKSFPEGCGFAPRMRVQHRPVVQMKQMRHDSGRRPRAAAIRNFDDALRECFLRTPPGVHSFHPA